MQRPPTIKLRSHSVRIYDAGLLLGLNADRTHRFFFFFLIIAIIGTSNNIAWHLDLASLLSFWSNVVYSNNVVFVCCREFSQYAFLCWKSIPRNTCSRHPAVCTLDENGGCFLWYFFDIKWCFKVRKRCFKNNNIICCFVYTIWCLFHCK